MKRQELIDLLERLKRENTETALEIKRLKDERLAIQNDSRTVTCVFCGHGYPPGTPPSNHEALIDHVENCPAHPMRKWRLRAEAAESYLNICRKSLEIENTPDADLITMSNLMIKSGEPLMAAICDAEREYKSFLKDK